VAEHRRLRALEKAKQNKKRSVRERLGGLYSRNSGLASEREAGRERDVDSECKIEEGRSNRFRCSILHHCCSDNMAVIIFIMG